MVDIQPNVIIGILIIIINLIPIITKEYKYIILTAGLSVLLFMFMKFFTEM